jgi:hypothetical protein
MYRCSTFSRRIWIETSPRFNRQWECSNAVSIDSRNGTSGNLAMLPSLPASREQLLNQQSHVVRPINSREANAINPNSLEHESGAFFHVLSHIQRRPAMPLRPIAPHLPIRIHQPHLPSSRRRLQTSCIRWRPSQRSTSTSIVINRNRNTKNNTYHYYNLTQ